jgi:amidase
MPMTKVEFHNLSVNSLSQGLRRGDWTSVDLAQHFLARIRALNPTIKAVPYLLPEQALAQAQESDRRRAAGQMLGALDGIPMTIKDANRVKGYPGPIGTWFMRNYVAKSDSRMVDALRRSGVVILGRTAAPTAAFDWNCRNQVYPECVNPLDPAKTPGGSSGGAAAALASGMSPLDLGSDLAGSIRHPAHCCGVFGLRTTDEWLPVDDTAPESMASGVRQILAYGPMTRFAEDLDLVLEVFEKTFPVANASTKPRPEGPLKIAFFLAAAWHEPRAFDTQDLRRIPKCAEFGGTLFGRDPTGSRLRVAL